MTVWRFLAGAALALAAMGCGSDAPGTADPTTPGDSNRRNVATEWYLRSISEDGRTINVVYTMSGVASGCERKGFGSADVSAGKVAVTTYKSVTLDRNRACTEELGYIEESVALDDPLGDRALVGCRPGKLEPSEDAVCRDLERSREQGIFDFPSRAPEG